MTMHFSAQTRLEAWVEASRHLRNRKIDINIILTIKEPLSDGPNSIEAMRLIDEYLENEKGLPMHTVAETIFPGWQYANYGIEGVYNRYPDEDYQFIKSPSDWGRYAYRMLRRLDRDKNVITDDQGEPVNPLKIMIEKMKREVGNKNTKRSCYDLGIGDVAFDLPLYDERTDAKKTRNLPCLSHITFKVFEDAVHLTAMYRSHCYRLKAYGNMLGLARLQACVAHEVDLPVGAMVIHSSYAFVTERLTALDQILDAVAPLIERKEAA